MIGIIKFFRDKDKLDQMVDGLFYCNTPEFYRLSDGVGVSDSYESCGHSYRKDRGDEPVSFSINGIELSHVNCITLHNNEFKDSWMHCWFALSMPETDDKLRLLVEDLSRMRTEFGVNYAFIEVKNISILVERLSSVTDMTIKHGSVRYAEDSSEWSSICKSTEYAYQREYRFLVGQCSHTDKEPIKLFYNQTFSDLMHVNKKLELSDNGQSLFVLDTEQCSSHFITS